MTTSAVFSPAGCLCFRKSSCTMAHLPVLLLGSRETIPTLKFATREFEIWAKNSCPFHSNINGWMLVQIFLLPFLCLGSPQPLQITHVAKKICRDVDVCCCHFFPLEMRSNEHGNRFQSSNIEVLTMFEILFANWSPPCRVLVDNLSEWFSIFFLLYRVLTWDLNGFDLGEVNL